MARPLKVGLSVAFWTLLAAAILFTGAVAVGAIRVHVMQTGSMSPAYPTGALVVLTSTQSANIVEGDVIAFNKPNSPGSQRGTTGDLYIHRVTDLASFPDGTVLVATKGDANSGVDDFSPFRIRDDRVWVARQSVPLVGTLVSTVSRIGSRGFLTVAGTLLLVGALLVLVWSPRKRDQRSATSTSPDTIVDNFPKMPKEPSLKPPEK